MNISGPCRVCGITVYSRTGPAGLICGPACKAMDERRQRAIERGAKPGDHDYYARTTEQRVADRIARRTRNWA